jgi:hypothetical protein
MRTGRSSVAAMRAGSVRVGAMAREFRSNPCQQSEQQNAVRIFDFLSDAQVCHREERLSSYCDPNRTDGSRMGAL